MQPTIKYTPADIVETTLISAVYLCATTLPYLFHGSLPSNLFGKGLRLLGLSSETIATQFKPIKFTLLLVGAAGAFVALALVEGGGYCGSPTPERRILTTVQGLAHSLL